MSDECTVASAQAALEEIAFELIALQERLESINRRLPVPPDQEAMLEGEIGLDWWTMFQTDDKATVEHWRGRGIGLKLKPATGLTPAPSTRP
jgi:hypothetical protein